MWDAYLSSLPSGPPAIAYVAITLFIPIIGTLALALFCVLIMVILFAAGIEAAGPPVHALGLFTILMGGGATANWARRRIRSMRSMPTIAGLDSVPFFADARSAAGPKAFTLATRLASGAPVPQGWVISGAAFREFVRASRMVLTDSHSTIQAAILAARVPRRFLRRLHRTLLASAGGEFVIRSSFDVEDRAERAAPGIYESTVWSVDQGVEGLDSALRHVWASYWGARAVAYRETNRNGFDTVPGLSILINVRIPHEVAGFASSADVSLGFRDRHWCETFHGSQPWVAVHHLLEGSVRSPEGRLQGGTRKQLVVDVSRMALEAEAALGGPVEIEWGVDARGIWLYQARPLTARPSVETYTNAYVVEVPRRPLTPLSDSFLFGEEHPAALLNRGLTFLGIPPFQDADFRQISGRWYVRVAAIKAFLIGGAAKRTSLRGVLRVVGLGLRSVANPRARRSRRGAMRRLDFGSDIPHDLAELRDAVLIPHIVREMRVLAVLAAYEALVGWRSDEGLGSPRGDSTTYSIITRTDADHELAERPVSAHLQDVAKPAERLKSSAKPAWSLRAWIHRSLVEEREDLRRRIELANALARHSAARLERDLASEIGHWQEGDVFFLTCAELAGWRRGTLGSADMVQRIAARKTRYGEDSRAEPSPIVHLDVAGQAVQERPPSTDPNVLALGIPLGAPKSVRGVLAIPPQTSGGSEEWARGKIVLLREASMRWVPALSQAEAVLIQNGGPLSHLALWCSEQRVPALVALRTAAGTLDPGMLLEVDLALGEVRHV